MSEWKLATSGITLPAAHVYGFTSRAIDRYDPAVEVITLGPKFYPAMEMGFSLEARAISRSQHSRAKLGRIFPKKKLRLGSGTYLDMRFDSPDNWAHNIFYQTPISLEIQRVIEQELTIVLPENLNRNIYDLYNLLGIKFIATDKDIEGSIISIEKSKVEISTLARRQWVEGKIEDLHNKLRIGAQAGSYPEKVFINRRDTRKLIGASVSDILKERGYQEVFLEDHSASEQIGILNAADDLVGIHGAGLAPILYSQKTQRLRRLVGLMPALQVTSGFRLLCYQCGMHWAGVRGKVDPDHAKYLYSNKIPPFKTSYKDFEVCTDSLIMALDDSANIRSS